MNFTKETKYAIFKASWIILMLGTICDLSLIENLNVGFFNINLQFSSLFLILYLVSFLIIYPLNKINLLFDEKINKVNIIILTLLLMLAFISSYFSIMQKYALVTTISRFTLYFLAFIATILNCRFFAKANEFILKSFIYANFIIVLSSIADYYIYDFNRLLVDNFGHMETKHSAIRIGQITYLRPSGFVTDTNLTAFTIAFASYLLILNRNKFNKFFTYAFYLLSGYSFGMLASRSALLLVIFFLAAALIFKQINWKPILIFTIIFSPIQLLTPQTQGRFFQVADKSKKVEEMETGRPLIWKADVFAMQVKPLLGLGTNVFFKQSDIFISKVRGQINDDIYLKELSDSSHQPEEGINPHNIFLSMIVEYGIAGILLFLILVIYNFNYILRIKKWNSLIAFTGILFVSSISNYAPYYKYYMLLCTVFYVNIKNDLRIERDAGQKK